MFVLKKELFIIGIRLQPSILFSLLSIDILKENEFNIHFLNITSLFKEVPQELCINHIEGEKVSYKDISEIKDMEIILEPNSIAIITGWIPTGNSLVTDILKKKAIYSIHLNLLPVNKPNYIAIGFNYIKHINSCSLNQYNAVIVDGYYKELLLKALCRKSQIWSIHSQIFESYYLNQEGNTKTGEGDQIIYVDQNLSEHPDFKWFNITKGSFNEYYIELNNTLKIISNQAQLPLKIALHPTANIITYKKLFPDFEIIKGETFNLIHNAKLVIGHYSGAIDYAILAEKKIVLIEIPKTISKKIYLNQKIYANKTGIETIKLPFAGDLMKSSRLNTKKREKYIHLFIKSKNSPNSRFTDIFIEHIDRIFKTK